MHKNNEYDTVQCNSKVKDIDIARKAIFIIIKTQKLSLFDIEQLFSSIIKEIREDNPITI